MREGEAPPPSLTQIPWSAPEKKLATNSGETKASGYLNTELIQTPYDLVEGALVSLVQVVAKERVWRRQTVLKRRFEERVDVVHGNQRHVRVALVLDDRKTVRLTQLVDEPVHIHDYAWFPALRFRWRYVHNLISVLRCKST